MVATQKSRASNIKRPIMNYPMDEPASKLLRCVPAKVLARFRDPAYRFLEKRETPVAVMFVDIEGCTRLCEDLQPGEINALIEAYFSRFFDAIEGVGGTVNEIMGDGFMAVFEDKDLRTNARSAVSAATEIQRQTAALNAHRLEESEPLLVNIGIHAGIALVGFTKFRSRSGERWTYTASGPVSNVGARLCALATGGSTLLSADVAGLLTEKEYSLEPLGAQILKNVSRPVPAFRLGNGNSGFDS